MKTLRKVMPTMVIISAVILSIGLCLFSSYAQDFTISLKGGLGPDGKPYKNLISIPIIPNNSSVPQALNFDPAATNITDVWGFAPKTAIDSDPWKHYRPDLEQYSDLSNIERGRGYYIFLGAASTDPTTLTITGAFSNAPYTLALRKGWNVIGWPFSAPQGIYETLSAAGLVFDVDGTGDYNQVSTFGFDANDPLTQIQLNFYNNTTTDTLDTFEPGKAYYIYCLTEKTVTLSRVIQIGITSHTTGQYVSSSPVTIAGTINDSAAEVEVAGEVNTISAIVQAGNWTADGLILNAGANTVTARVLGATNEDTIILTLDETPPNSPTITAAEYRPAPADELFASWVAADLESGIAEYQYAVGTEAYPAPGATSVQDWAATLDMASEISYSAALLTQGVPYYITVKAKNGANSWSLPVSTGEIIITANRNLPVINNITPLSGSSVLAGSAITFSVDATDADGDALSYQFSWRQNQVDPWQVLGAWQSSSQFTWQTTTADWGANLIKIEVTDSNGGVVPPDRIVSTDPDNIGILVQMPPIAPPAP